MVLAPVLFTFLSRFIDLFENGSNRKINFYNSESDNPYCASEKRQFRHMNNLTYRRTTITRNIMESIHIRHANENDINYIIHSFTNSYRDHTTWKLIRLMPISEYKKRYRKIIESILLLPDIQINIACNDDSDFILGFSITQPNTIHYVHVREAFQRLGIAKQLLSSFIVQPGSTVQPYEVKYSHQTSILNVIRIPANWHFCPWLIIGLGE